MKNNLPTIIQQTASFIQKDFEVDGVIPADVTEEELLHFLKQLVREWLDTGLDKLFYALYRLDINEYKVHRALRPDAAEEPHIAIAQLILDREKQKAITRLEYSLNNTDKGDGWNS